MNVCIVVLEVLLNFALFFKAEGNFCMWLEKNKKRERNSGTNHQLILTRS